VPSLRDSSNACDYALTEASPRVLGASAQIVEAPLAKSYPPDRKYTAKLLQRLVDQIEQSGDGVVRSFGATKWLATYLLRELREVRCALGPTQDIHDDLYTALASNCVQQPSETTYTGDMHAYSW